MTNLIDLQRRIKETARHEKGYNTGIIGEVLIVSAYKQMKIEDLEKLRVILNNIIREKKEYKRIREHNDKLHNNNNLHNNMEDPSAKQDNRGNID
jgi:hypothetical protein